MTVQLTRFLTADEASYRAKFPKHDGPFHWLGLLSEHYWQTWSRVRPPLCVVCPNGAQWEIDRKSSNGSGWVVTGSWPNLNCSPSIVVPGYHGFLQNGAFTVACLSGSHP